MIGDGRTLATPKWEVEERQGSMLSEPVVARFPPQTAKRWPDYCHKPRNRNLCGEIRLKQASVDIHWEGGCSSSLRIVLELAGIRGMHMIEALAIALATVAMGIPAMIVATALGSRLGFYW